MPAPGPPGPDPADPPALRRTLGTWSLFVFVVGDIFGAGIYLLVGVVEAEVGGLVWLPFLLAFVVAALTAGSYAELATRFPDAAGSAHYIDRAFGRPLLTAVVGLAVVASGLTAAATASRAVGGRYLAAFVDLPAAPVAVGVIAALTLLNHIGVKESARANVVMTAVEAGGLALVIVVGVAALAAGDGDPSRALDAGGTDPGVLGLLGATALAFFALLGFEDSVHLAEEVQDPVRSYPRALLGGLALTGAVYVVVTVIAAMVVPPGTMAGSTGPLLEVVDVGPLAVPRRLFSAIALAAVTNTALIALVTASRLLFGLGRGGTLPARLGRVHPRRRTPTAAVLVAGGVAAVLAATGELAGLAETTVVLLLCVFAIVDVSVLVLRRRPDEPPGFTVPRAVPALGAVVSVALVVDRLLDGGWPLAARLVALVGAGFVVHLVVRWREHRRPGPAAPGGAP